MSVPYIENIRIRRRLCDMAIKTLMSSRDDPRAVNAIEHYTAQLHELDAELTRLEAEERQRLGLPEPEPIVVGLQPAHLFGTALS